MRHFRVNIVAAENQQVSHILSVCVCALNYPAPKAHAPNYIVINSLSGITVFFSHYLIKGTIFAKRN